MSAPNHIHDPGLASWRRRALLMITGGHLMSARAAQPEVRNGLLGLVVPSTAFTDAEGGAVMRDFVNLMNMVDDGPGITLQVQPRARIEMQLKLAAVDFAVPFLQIRADDVPGYCRYGAEALSPVSFVLYTMKHRGLTVADLRAAQSREPFPYRVEAPPYVDWGFPVMSDLHPESSFKRLLAGRTDAVLRGQEGGDYLLSKLRGRSVRRELFGNLHDVFAYPHGPRGAAAEVAIAQKLERLRMRGLLAPWQLRLHRPFQAQVT